VTTSQTQGGTTLQHGNKIWQNVCASNGWISVSPGESLSTLSYNYSYHQHYYISH